MSYLLDTCVVSEFGRPRPDPGVVQWLGQQKPDALYLSEVTVAELSAGLVKLRIKDPGRTNYPEPASPLINQMHEMNALSQISIEDWDKLFQSVESRLCASIEALDPAHAKVRMTVLECVEALD